MIQFAPHPDGPGSPRDTEVAACTAVVPLELARTDTPRAAVASAEMIAQLLSERLGLPQGRRRRRAEPAEATRAYAARPVLQPGRTLTDA